MPHLDRLTSVSADPLCDRAYTYDLLGRPLTAGFVTCGETVTNAFDALGRLTSASSNAGGTAHPMTYLYDLAGRRTRVTWWDGFTADYDRLVTGEVSKVRENGAVSGVGVLASYAYDNLGNRLSLTFGNGVVQTFTYDPVSRLSVRLR